MSAIEAGSKSWRRRLWYGLAVCAAAVLVPLGVCAVLPPATTPIAGKNAIAELREITLGGFPQTVLLRGVDRRNPLILYVHGGPGSAHLVAAPGYSHELEKRFVVAHWDQRGAGASCSNVDWSTLSLERIVEDTIELSAKLGAGRKIFLLGHSWGSLVGAIAVQRRPDLYYAYVGTGQLVHRDRQEQISYDWVVEQARRANNQDALTELATIHPPYTTQAEFSLQRGWLGEFDGEIYQTERAREFLPAAIFGREYSLLTRLRYQSCFKKSLEQLLQDRLRVDLFTNIPRLEVPVFLFTGRHDYNTPFALVEAWGQRLKAPHVEMVWFEDAGHFLAIEAPEEFQAKLIANLLPLARD